MPGKPLALISALAIAAWAAPAAAEGLNGGSPEQGGIDSGRAQTGGQSYGNRDRGGRSGFYSYPRHRHVDARGGSGLDRRSFSSLDGGTAPHCGNCHGSAYYGRDYGAPYFGGGYYDRGVYYRERRD